MDEQDQVIRRLRESIENAKQLRREVEERINALSKLIESAEALRDRGMRVIFDKGEEQP